MKGLTVAEGPRAGRVHAPVSVAAEFGQQAVEQLKLAGHSVHVRPGASKHHIQQTVTHRNSATGVLFWVYPPEEVGLWHKAGPTHAPEGSRPLRITRGEAAGRRWASTAGEEPQNEEKQNKSQRGEHDLTRARFPRGSQDVQRVTPETKIRLVTLR